LTHLTDDKGVKNLYKHIYSPFNLSFFPQEKRKAILINICCREFKKDIFLPSQMICYCPFQWVINNNLSKHNSN